MSADLGPRIVVGVRHRRPVRGGVDDGRYHAVHRDPSAAHLVRGHRDQVQHRRLADRVGESRAVRDDARPAGSVHDPAFAGRLHDPQRVLGDQRGGHQVQLQLPGELAAVHLRQRPRGREPSDRVQHRPRPAERVDQRTDRGVVEHIDGLVPDALQPAALRRHDLVRADHDRARTGQRRGDAGPERAARPEDQHGSASYALCHAARSPAGSGAGWPAPSPPDAAAHGSLRRGPSAARCAPARWCACARRNAGSSAAAPRPGPPRAPAAPPWLRPASSRRSARSGSAAR